MGINKHLFITGEIAKLNIKKDSSLLLAHKLKEAGAEVYLLEENSFYLTPHLEKIKMKAHKFISRLKEDSFYMESFSLGEEADLELNSSWLIHMRSDPPVDQRYTRILWMLKNLKKKGVKITNDPLGILSHNEKLIPFDFNIPHVPSYYGGAGEALKSFLKTLTEDAIIVKPIDSFSGIGVEKIEKESLSLDEINERIAKRKEAVIVQPFIKEVTKGEHRALYLGGNFIGAMIKIPPEKSFLANIAQGARFEKAVLSSEVKSYCQKISDELLKDGIDFIAFDILGNKVTEVNITCPGLVNEVSMALGVDIGKIYADYFLKS